MICSSCSADMHPVKEMQVTGGFVDTCPKCGALNASAKAVSATSVASPVHVSQPSATVSADEDILSLAKRRLAALRIEIAALEKLKREAARLELMIEAADSIDEAEAALHPEH